MAPKVLQPGSGYDFNMADICSFGFMAPELAHGHASVLKHHPSFGHGVTPWTWFIKYTLPSA
ncbi:hypothetical protein Tco_1084795, partial [Tanacetum coccineum]